MPHRTLPAKPPGLREDYWRAKVRRVLDHLDDYGGFEPPWVVHPDIPAGSMGWRMGVGETTADDFWSWTELFPEDAVELLMACRPWPAGWHDTVTEQLEHLAALIDPSGSEQEPPPEDDPADAEEERQEREALLLRARPDLPPLWVLFPEYPSYRAAMPHLAARVINERNELIPAWYAWVQTAATDQVLARLQAHAPWPLGWVRWAVDQVRPWDESIHAAVRRHQDIGGYIFDEWLAFDREERREDC